MRAETVAAPLSSLRAPTSRKRKTQESRAPDPMLRKLTSNSELAQSSISSIQQTVQEMVGEMKNDKNKYDPVVYHVFHWAMLEFSALNNVPQRRKLVRQLQQEMIEILEKCDPLETPTKVQFEQLSHERDELKGEVNIANLKAMELKDDLARARLKISRLESELQDEKQKPRHLGTGVYRMAAPGTTTLIKGSVTQSQESQESQSLLHATGREEKFGEPLAASTQRPNTPDTAARDSDEDSEVSDEESMQFQNLKPTNQNC